ncbi:FtsK/SpoIIIE domain-containing protein [Gottfriedia sp. NPDC058432]|uniref:FtsK/SpoIIIE domain-containing protein n=1 Tax=Gottfriedia sp. NPDC058432 TaxID=3346497 RepID=UPI003662085F
MIIILFSSIVSASIVVGLGASVGVIKPRAYDKKTIKRLFEIANVCVKEKDIIKYPTFKKSVPKDNHISFFYRLPLGIPSKLIIQFQEILSEGLNKPVVIDFSNYQLEIKVFHNELIKKYKWHKNVLKSNSYEVFIGKSLTEDVYHDFESIPHIVIGGGTGYGKTVLLKLMFTQLILQNPDDVEFYIIDLKEKLEIGRYQNVKQVKAIAGNYVKAVLLLKDIVDDMFNSIKELKRNGYVTNVKDLNRKRKFIIVDEAEELAPKGDGETRKILLACQDMLSSIARLGRAVGYRLIFATQYPTGDTLPRQIKQNADCRIGLRLTTAVASDVVIDEKGLEKLPYKLSGRAIMKTDKKTELQIPYISDSTVWEVLKGYEEEKRRTYRTDTSKSENTEIRNKKAASRNSQSRRNKKRSKATEKPSRDGIIISD